MNKLLSFVIDIKRKQGKRDLQTTIINMLIENYSRGTLFLSILKTGNVTKNTFLMSSQGRLLCRKGRVYNISKTKLYLYFCLLYYYFL